MPKAKVKANKEKESVLDSLVPGEISEGLFFRNKKTSDRYVVIGFAICTDNGKREGQTYVAYKPVDGFGVGSQTYTRNLGEFCKKFTHV